MRTRLLALPAAALILGGAVTAGAVVHSADAASHRSGSHQAGRTKPVAVVDDMFKPTSRTVKKGETVSWVWKGMDPHNVTISGPKKAHSMTQTDGTYSVRFTKAGTYQVVCTIHQSLGMRMTITVT